MTSETGKNSPQPQQSPDKFPWERLWNSQATPVAERSKQAPTEASKASTGISFPWERSWKKNGGKKEFNYENYLSKLSAAESSNDPRAKATTSSASGLYQFTSGTWMDWVNKLEKPYTLKDRFDPKKAKEIAVEFTKSNVQKAKEHLGRDPSTTDVYFYHLLGNASQFLKAPRETPAVDHVSARAAKANKNVFYKENGKPYTVGEVYERFRKKFEGE